MKRRRWELGEA